MFSNQYVSTGVLQTLLDDLYAKASRPLNDCVLMLFENKYLARTGLTAPTNTTSQNTWRNNFNLQKGIGCYAPPQVLASLTFLSQSRSDCQYLQPTVVGQLSGATCQLCTSSARYRAEEHPKWLRIDPGGAGYAVVDLMNIPNFINYVAPNNQRIPLLPLIVALYYDALPGLATAGYHQVDSLDFANNFNFSAPELAAYFDEDTANSHNCNLVQQFPGITYTPMAAQSQSISTARRVVGQRNSSSSRSATIPSPILSGTQVPPPGVNTGWEAEQFVAAVLRNHKWSVDDVSRQRLGYDLLAHKGRQTRYIDVKSSLGYCSPTLTAREWQQAVTHGSLYVLAIIENFNASGQNVIFWVPDPAQVCSPRPTTVVQYSISRSSWQSATVQLTSI